MRMMKGSGYRFAPNDRELICSYLHPRVLGMPLPCNVVSDCKVYDKEPWLLPKDSYVYGGGIKEQYFFALVNKKSEKSSRADRKVKDRGYWRASTGDKTICEGKHKIGFMKTFVYHKKDVNDKSSKKGIKTNWIMHEYRLSSYNFGGTIKHAEWVLCRIKENKPKNTSDSYEETNQKNKRLQLGCNDNNDLFAFELNDGSNQPGQGNTQENVEAMIPNTSNASDADIWANVSDADIWDNVSDADVWANITVEELLGLA